MTTSEELLVKINELRDVLDKINFTIYFDPGEIGSITGYSELITIATQVKSKGDQLIVESNPSASSSINSNKIR